MTAEKCGVLGHGRRQEGAGGGAYLSNDCKMQIVKGTRCCTNKCPWVRSPSVPSQGRDGGEGRGGAGGVDGMVFLFSTLL